MRLNRNISLLLAKCRNNDPSPVSQQAIPSSTVRLMAEVCYSAADVTTHAVGALGVVAFFFMLRVGEYTPPNGPRPTRTVQLRKGDVRLWQTGEAMNLEAPWAELNTADAVTIKLENQKNGQRGTTLHHHESGHPIMCPVRAMVRLVYGLQGLPPTSALGTHRMTDGSLRQVQSSQMRAAVRLAAELDGLESRGYDLNRVGNHSLRSGGATALKLAGYDSDMIKKLGRWSSNTYLTYIQSQIAQLTENVASRMGRHLTFQNVG